MKQPEGFLALKNRYILEGELVSEAPLHIGGAAPSPQTDAPFLRDAAGAYIPGSSVRGVLRSTLERILQSLDGARGCVLFAEGTHPSCLTDEKNLKAFNEELRGTDAENEEALQRKVLGDGQCDICKLFGSPLMASKLRIADCRLNPPGEFTIRDGVGIDRDTEAAREKIKFDFEALDNGAVFSFCLQLENAEHRDFALLAILLSEMTQRGIEVGGKKSRGFGRVRLKLKESVSFFDNLATFLTTGLQTMRADEFQRQIGGHLANYLQEGNHAAPGCE